MFVELCTLFGEDDRAAATVYVSFFRGIQPSQVYVCMASIFITITKNLLLYDVINLSCKLCVTY
jgi:hypothetical protein